MENLFLSLVFFLYRCLTTGCKICCKSVEKGPQSIYLAPHTPSFTLQHDTFGLTEKLVFQTPRSCASPTRPVDLEARNLWCLGGRKRPNCLGVSGSSWFSSCSLSSFMQFGYSILGINQFWAIPLFGDLDCPFGGRNRGMTGHQRSWSFLLLPCRWLGRNGPTWCLQFRGSLVEIHPRNFSWAWALLPTCPVWILESAILRKEWSFVERCRISTLMFCRMNL